MNGNATASNYPLEAGKKKRPQVANAYDIQTRPDVIQRFEKDIEAADRSLSEMKKDLLALREEQEVDFKMCSLLQELFEQNGFSFELITLQTFVAGVVTLARSLSCAEGVRTTIHDPSGEARNALLIEAKVEYSVVEKR